MKIRYLIAAAGAALGLSFSGHTASAQTAAVGEAGGSLTLIHMHGGGGGGGYHPSFGFSHPGPSFHPNWSGAHPGWNAMRHNWSGANPGWKAMHPNWTGARPKLNSVQPSWTGWHHHHHHRRGYWRNGYWYGYDYGGIGGDSCYAECRVQGYSPAYCTANAYAFCW